MLDVVRLKIFAEVARTGSIARAASGLGYTASAVSQQLSKLEREAGAILATRTHAGIELTAEGRVLLAHADDVLDRLATAEQAVRDAAGLRSSEVRLGGFTSGALTLLAPAIAVFRTKFPAVRLSLAEVEPPGGYGGVRTGELDLLLSHVYPGTVPPDPTGLVVAKMFADPLVAAIPADWPVGRDGDALPARQLAGIPLISGGPGHANRIALERMLSAAGVTSQVEFETRDYAVTLALVAAGAGATVMPWSLLAAKVPAGVRVRRFRDGEARTVLAVHRPMPPGTTVMSFLEIVRQTAADLIGSGAGLSYRGE
ncbi:LysR substrate-binding domain-containing protein [Actinomadura sp. BRA 177]|uniref:LysR family transcriptional regulator n=1 Tax=Actinomadura sp. BRA 177 TaxID=2745202 RepID=UPI0015963B44|nr:LysR substrate-binding domain-containing protein [Actinomadura sp. BRA 177]NVI91638.1 LysR family transcriptional regulator [Actinomadura sp. BRA 177]